MKHATKALVSALVITIFTQSFPITLDQVTIDKKAFEIEKNLQRERYMMYGLTTIAVAHEIYQWVPLLKSLFISQSPSEKKPEIGFFESIKEGAKQTFYTKEGWSFLFESALSMSFGICGIVVISQMGEQYIHPDTLRWYIAAYAPYQKTIRLMKEQVSNLQDPSIDIQQQKINHEMLQLLYDRLVQHATFMCAYITYKIKCFDRAERVIGERTKNAMFKVNHKWLHDLEEELNSTSPDYAHIENILVSYENGINAQVNHFALVEGETRRERTAIKNQMKQ